VAVLGAPASSGGPGPPVLDEGLSVAVMARGTGRVAAVFSGPRLRLLRGDIADAGAVAQAVAGAGAVVNLAHGGGGASYAAIRARWSARRCRGARLPRRGHARLLHVGSLPRSISARMPAR